MKASKTQRESEIPGSRLPPLTSLRSGDSELKVGKGSHAFW